MTTAAASDWYPDPTRRHELRYWDGHQWTDYVADGGVQSQELEQTVVEQPEKTREAVGEDAAGEEPRAEDIPPAWYPDPSRRHEVRYWNGTSWTYDVADAGVTATDAPVAGEAPDDAASARAHGSGSYAQGPVARQQGEEYADITVSVAAPEAREALVQELAAKGFRMTWAGEWQVTAEKGNVASNVLLGGVAQYFKFSADIYQGGEHATVVRLIRDPVGYWGGALGRSRVSSTFKTVVNDIAASFAARGLLLNVEHLG